MKEKIEQWFVERGISEGDGHAQLAKLVEEVNELIMARGVENRAEEIDAVGDILVVLIGYCLQRGLDIEKCLEVAYEEIKDRTGKVIGGSFVKD